MDVTLSNKISEKGRIQFTPVVLLGTHSLHAFLTSQNWEDRAREREKERGGHLTITAVARGRLRYGPIENGRVLFFRIRVPRRLRGGIT